VRRLAFYFAREDDASAARTALREEKAVDEDQVALAPLVVDREEGTILAIAADTDRRPEILDVAERHGGRLVADIPDERF
jgi:hypothetical protein